MNDQAVVGWGALAASLVFVLVAVVLTGRQHLGLGRPILVALVRSLVQMALVGLALVPVLDPDTPLVWSLLWVAAIVVFASITVARRAPQVPGLIWVAAGAMALVAVTGLGVIYGLRIFPLQGRTLVPVAGMVIGNSMNAAVVGATRVATALADQRAEVEAGLALGMTPGQASRRVVRGALRTAMTPQVEQTAGLGLIVLPGTMTGLLLAGASPFEAVRTQLALMYVILAGVVIAATVAGLGTLRQLTTADQTILRLERR